MYGALINANFLSAMGRRDRNIQKETILYDAAKWSVPENNTRRPNNAVRVSFISFDRWHRTTAVRALDSNTPISRRNASYN